MIPPDPAAQDEAFVANQAFLRRLARELVGDAALADDLVQDTWMAVAAEYLGEPADVVEGRVRAIAPRMMRVLEVAKSENLTPHQAADRIVRERLATANKN
jgi:hypothetical protein